jgi:hypothetical protein
MHATSYGTRGQIDSQLDYCSPGSLDLGLSSELVAASVANSVFRSFLTFFGNHTSCHFNRYALASYEQKAEDKNQLH